MEMFYAQHPISKESGKQSSKLLMGFNKDVDEVRSHILGKKPLLSVGESVCRSSKGRKSLVSYVERHFPYNLR